MNLIKRIFSKKKDIIYIPKRTFYVSYYFQGCDGVNIKETIQTLARTQKEAEDNISELMSNSFNEC